MSCWFLENGAPNYKKSGHQRFIIKDGVFQRTCWTWWVWIWCIALLRSCGFGVVEAAMFFAWYDDGSDVSLEVGPYVSVANVLWLCVCWWCMESIICRLIYIYVCTYTYVMYWICMCLYVFVCCESPFLVGCKKMNRFFFPVFDQTSTLRYSQRW